VRRRLLPALLCALALLAAACGGGGDEPTTSTDAEQQETGTEELTAEPTPDVPATVDQEIEMTEGDAGVQVTGDAGAKPEITIPDTEPPTTLHWVDLIEGDGAEVAAGATVTTHYVGVSWSTGEQFDSSWDRGEPIQFPLAGVITGWQEGIPGMKVGGRRLLVIPPDLGYGEAGTPGGPIGPNETLVFVIDMVSSP
jgi:peptidylprolyl isomerase